MRNTGELVLPLDIHHRQLWLIVHDLVVGAARLVLVLDSGAPASSMKLHKVQELAELGSAERLGGRGYRLHGLVASGVTIPDMTVRAGGRIEEMTDIDGLMGLDYLYQFARVCVDVPTLELRLLPQAGQA